MLKTYQFKTHCKGYSHSSKTEISFCQDQNKGELPYKRLSNSFNCIIMLVETTHLAQVECYISLADVRTFTFVLS